MAETEIAEGLKIIAEGDEYVVLAASLAKLGAEVVDLLQDCLEEDQKDVEEIGDFSLEKLDVPDKCMEIDSLEDTEEIRECANKLVIGVRKRKIKKLEEIC